MRAIPSPLCQMLAVVVRAPDVKPEPARNEPQVCPPARRCNARQIARIESTPQRAPIQSDNGLDGSRGYIPEPQRVVV